jgi:nitrilase
MTSGEDVAANLDQAERLMRAGAGTELLVLPENFALMAGHPSQRLELAARAPEIADFLSRQARECGCWLVGGTVPWPDAEDARRVRARCQVFAPDGDLAGHYDKIHLFDVDLPGGEQYRESDYIAPGGEPVAISVGPLRLGLSVCYDLRFPEYFRRLLDLGANLFAVPSAFTAQTGAAHWETLLRARAIENLAWVIGANQAGVHPGGRSTWGHSMIVDPWGQVLATAGTGPDIVVCELETRQGADARRRLPSIDHRRF